MATVDNLILDITQSVTIEAAPGDAWAALMARMSSENTTPNNAPMPMVLEQWPGGRWFRDLGDGQGHLWGFVQVIKPPTLLEIHGPMFMSYAVSGHLQLRLSQIPGGVELTLRHQVLGSVQEDHRQGMTAGWDYKLQSVKADAESRV